MTIRNARTRQRRRPWLAAMAVTLPVSTESYASSSVPPSFASSTPLHAVSSPDLELLRPLARQTIVMDMPSMLLNSKQTTFTAGGTDGRYGGRATGTIPLLDEEEDQEILGFDVSSSSLRMARPSNVDPDTWKEGGETSSPIKKNSVPLSLFRKTAIPAWLPWIPTRAQIEELKVVELKQACDERGLTKTGRKADLQGRLWDWAQQQHRQRVTERRAKPQWNMGMPLSEVYSTSKPTEKPTRGSRGTSSDRDSSEPRLEANSLAEWARNVDVEPLRNRREAIRRDKHNKAKKVPPPKNKEATEPLDYRKYLQKAFEAPSSQYSNRDVKQLYHASKLADQAGDREAAKTLLQTLVKATPQDARLYRRLARMQSEEGSVEEARATLQEGLRLMPENGYLWHGMGQLEHSLGATDEARRCYHEAIRVDPQIPNPYHALGTLEHMQGRIAVAKKILKEGIEYCPKNHRLHHALGDLYREAKMLDSAERAYRRALELSPPVSHCFAYTALAYVAYERGRIDECRSWLRKSVSLNDGRHSQGWVALAQMEEAEGNVDAARGICIGAISQYERGLLQRKGNFRERWNAATAFAADSSRPVQIKGENKVLALKSKDLLARKEDLFQTVPQYRSGDKFINVFRNWARLEETHGSPDSVDEVYTRASFAFPYDWKLMVNWAQYYTTHSLPDKARSLFLQACQRAKNLHADPYRLYAEYEMAFGNYQEARKILFRGAQAMSTSSDGGLGNRCGMAELFHTWAVCEWHLGNFGHAELLFDDALRMTESGDSGSKLRSFVLYSIARLQYDRGEYELARHCIALCLKENMMPGGNSKIWELWSHVAAATGNEELSKQCRKTARDLQLEEQFQGEDGLASLLRQKTGALSQVVGAASQPLMRRDPWHDKIFAPKSSTPGFFKAVKLPEVEHPNDDETLEESTSFEFDVRV